MILYHTALDAPMECTTGGIPTLVIEAPSFFRELVADLYSQQAGNDGHFFLTENGKDLPIGTWVEILDQPLRLTLNTKPLLTKITAALERYAVSEAMFLKTADLLRQLEQYTDELSFGFSGDFSCQKCTVGGILKGVGLGVREEYDDPLEKMIDYMELVREFDRNKLFVLVNLRSWFSDKQLELFLDDVLTHGFRVLLMDAFAREKLSVERRITVDNDLCEF